MGGTAGKSGRQAQRVTVRSATPLDRDLVREIRERVSGALGSPVRLVEKTAPGVRGVRISVGGRFAVTIDVLAPFRRLEEELTRAVAEQAARGYGVDEETAGPEAVIERYASAPAVTVGETELARALGSYRSSHVTLQVKVPLDESVIRALKDKLSEAAGRQMFVDVRLSPRLEAGAILFIGEDRRIVLDTRYAWLADLERSFVDSDAQVMAAPEESGAAIRRAIQDTQPELTLEEMGDTGHALEVGDGVASVSGLKRVGSQELVRFECGVWGLAFSLSAEAVGVILLGPEEEIREGSEVSRSGHLLKVPVGEALVGRIVNALGQPIDARGPIEAQLYRPIEKKAPGVVQRQPVREPLHSGIKVLDALVPLGRGQRELILGDRKIGKTTIAVDTILSQKDHGVQCVYASVGQKASSVARVVRTLKERGAMEYTTVVVALPNEQPAFRHITPYTACTIGEHIMEEGGHALVIYDDLSKHAVTYREMSALLKRPIGREAYPGDVFYIHSRLLERAAKLSEEHGGGSLTALPIVETLAGDISAFIPTNVVSICDGQIFLDTNLFNEGFRPAVDAGLSVSRVGGAAQTAAMKAVAGRLRIDLAQYQEMAQFVKFGAEVDQATMDQLTRGERTRELLKQAQHSPLATEQEVASLYAVINGYMDDVPVEDVAAFESRLLDFLAARHPAVLASIAETTHLTRMAEEELVAAVGELKEQSAARTADVRTAG